MNILPRSELHKLNDPERFFWATGIEDTFVTAAHPKTSRHIDEYELTGHYERWNEDIDLVKELGVKVCRYGIPWHKIQPQRENWSWDWTDRVLNKFTEAGIDPILDLVHYGLPSWIEGAYLHNDFPFYMQEYATQTAQRFDQRILWYTPLNEPRIAAWYCGKLGWWPPFKRGWGGFLRIMNQICRGIVLTTNALRAVNPENVSVHVDATDLYSTADPDLQKEVELRQELVFLALDLVTGRVTDRHKLYPWLVKHGIKDEDVSWFQDNNVDLDLIGINLYPMFTNKVFSKRGNGIRVKMEYANPSLLVDLAKLYWNRYQRPLMITETASLGSFRRRLKWLKGSIEAVRDVQAQGIPLIGYTWWPLFGLIAWSYRQGKHPLQKYILQMGLWNLDPALNRIRTPLVDEYKSLVQKELAGAELLK